MKASSNFPIVSFFAFTRTLACGSEKYLESVAQRHWIGFRKGLPNRSYQNKVSVWLWLNLNKMEEIICDVVDLSPNLSAGSLLLVHCSKFIFSRKYWFLSHYYWMIINLSRIPCLQSWMLAWGGCSVIHIFCHWSKAWSLTQIYSSPCSFCLSPKVLHGWFSIFIILSGNWQLTLQLCSPLLTFFFFFF